MTLAELRIFLAELICDTAFAGKSFFAGGCVRDELLRPGQDVLDADIAVELENGGVRLARTLQKKLNTAPPEVPRGFGTASLAWQGIQLDFVMTRSETYPPGSRHPRVKFATLAQDCQRRDFTVNALYQEILRGTTSDPCCRGFADLEARLIRSLREPNLSFQEDPLRMLRALRFAAVLDFQIEPSNYSAIGQNAPLTGSLSRRRLDDELARLREKCSPKGLERWREMLAETGVGVYLERKVKLL